jgi:PAS domain S-box-containing protein
MKRSKVAELSELSKQLRSQTSLVNEERARADALVSSIGEGVIATDENGKIIQVNQVALDILGYKRRELVGKWFPEKVLVVTEDNKTIPALERPATKVFLTGKVVNDRLYFRKKSGETVPVAITASPIFLRGEPIGIIELFRDISKEVESDRVKSEFISLAAHQLRTPLSSVGLYSNMLGEGYAGKLTKEQTKLLEVIVGASNRMNGLINSLLNVTRIDSDDITIESKPMMLVEVLEKLLSDLKPQITNKKIKLRQVIEKDIPQINSDPTIVREILDNILSNSVKYTPGGGKITLSVIQKRGSINITVKDNGYGIPVQSQDYIFNKFFRASNIIKYDVSGTGLGLYFTKSLANRIDSDIWFESKENIGTTFYLSIPIKGIGSKKGKFKIAT